MSLSLSCARATITKFKADKKPDDDGTKVLVTALKVEVKTSADVLAEFHPTLRAALFVRDSGVRFRSMKEIGWEGTRRNVDLAVRPGPDMKPALKLSDVTLRDFRIKPLEEGGQQLVALKFAVDVEDPSTPVGRILEYLKEEAWIDLHGGGELDLAPPSARETIEGIDDSAPVAGAAPKQELSEASVAMEASVSAVRKLQPSRKGVKARLESYPDEVLRAAIAAEGSAADSRPMFISMLEAELTRRHETSQETAK